MPRSPATPPVLPAARRLRADDVRAAYRRMAALYDPAFAAISRSARAQAVEMVNLAPGPRVLEVGVGTGLSLPLYDRAKRITGIDLSADMLARARAKVADQGLDHVEALLELDAERTGLPEAGFDVAVAMFVASVVPDPAALLAEMKRIVRPGGMLVFVNHFSALSGPRLWAERALQPAARVLGWRPDFPVEALLPDDELAHATRRPIGLFTLVQMENRA